MKESVILCEGYHDRAFWAGWLEHLGCTDPGKRPGKKGRVPVVDAWDVRVAGGHVGYHSKSGKFVRIFHCDGKKNVYREARNRLKEEADRLSKGATEPRLARLIVNMDADVNADGSPLETGFTQHDLRPLVKEYDPSAGESAEGDVLLFDGAVIVSLVRWESGDGPAAGLPSQQTLERVVCAAVVAAYPKRGPAVHTWLESRPKGPAAGPKEYAWSHMAGWYADRACEGFYRRLWDDDKVVSMLESRLRQSGAWRIAEALAE